VTEGAPYAALSPDVVLAAVDEAGSWSDGRLLTLNSYENRVFQVGLEDGGFVVAKFYRPGRWTDAAILEEHAFALELAAAELPMVAPLAFDGRTMLRHAGIALARAKGDGGQRMCFFEHSMDKALQRRRMVEHELRLALGREEFEVVYQPQYDLATERQCGSEALVRWHHPVHGKIAPGHFISVAEDTGLIVPLGEWVLRRACTDAAKWPDPLIVAVNLSPAQFRDGDIAETVAEVLKETKLPPERLELEITENLLINDTEEVLGKLNRLRQLGVAIAMDDFGTGYSSLNYLARFPFSKIKIDRQFIRNMTRDPATRAIVKTIIALGKSLDVTITAEGVETQEQAAILREFGCPQVQGFLYGYPGAAETGVKPEGNVTSITAARSSAA